MADDADQANQAQPQPPRLQVLGQYIRDMSFENIAAQKGTQGTQTPDINVAVNLDANQRGDKQFEVITKLNIEARAKEGGAQIFLMEIEYAGLFHVDNVPNEQLHPFLMIECPRMVFPFLRRIVHDVTRDGGYPPLNLENIDFLAMYQAEIARRTEAEKPN